MTTVDFPVDPSHHDIQGLIVDYWPDTPIITIEQGDDCIEISPEMWAVLRDRLDSLLK